MVRVSEIHCEGNGHRDVGDLRRLAGSIQDHGIKVPLQVYRRNGGYGLIDGGDRLAAAEMLGLPEVPAEIVEQPEETEDAISGILARLRSAELGPLERGCQYARLVDLGCTQREIARSSGRNVATISQEMALLRLIPELQEAIAKGQLAARAGYHLSRLNANQQREAMDAALAARSTRRIARMVKAVRGKAVAVKQPAVEDARRVRKGLGALKRQLPLPEPVRDELEPVLIQIDGQLKEIWRLM